MRRHPHTMDTYVPIGGLLVCYCGIPHARRTSNHTLEEVKFYDGERVVSETSYENGCFKLSCPICHGGFIFEHFTEVMHMNEETEVALEHAK